MPAPFRTLFGLPAATSTATVTVRIVKGPPGSAGQRRHPVRATLPLGWGDTCTQSLDGQNFNVTQLPNGTYYIEVIANPEKVLHETDTANDVSLRKIILGGTPDHRTVRVPPFTA